MDKYIELLNVMKAIAKYDPKNKQGLTNAWSESFAFYKCKKMANDVLKEIGEDK